MKLFYASELVRKVVVDYLNNLPSDKYDLQLSISPEAQSCMINGHMRLFERALTNIIGNSTKRNENGCEIYVEIEKKDDNCVIEIKYTGSVTDGFCFLEVGRSFEESKQILDGITFPNKMGMCFDSCHVYDAGYAEEIKILREAYKE